jgi:tetratricopeptide (TPR) repeat protein
MNVSSRVDVDMVQQRIQDMLDRKAFQEAVDIVDSCTGSELLIDQVRAFTWAESGFHLNDQDMLKRAIAVWSRLGTDDPGIAYNMANTENELWLLAVKRDGRVGALESARSHLHRARALFSQVGDDSKAAQHYRVQALTNLGNTYDHMGRDIDALDCYERALAVDPKFGMALGNKAVALIGIAPHMGSHKHAILAPAVEALDAAIADEQRILQFGGRSALEHFRAERGRFPEGAKGGHRTSAPASWDDPHLRWCLQHGLFLHVSQACIRGDLDKLDPLFFARVVTPLDDAGQVRARQLFDAFNAAKQEYVAARYLTWLAGDGDAPILGQARMVSEKVSFPDSLTYARWGVRTGLGIQAFAAAVNVLDKVAGLVHLYFESGRVRDVYFRTLWHRRGDDAMDRELSSQLTRRGLNRGLLALCDLSSDIEQDTPLNQFIERRHTATHRFLVAHEMLLAADDDDWLERVTWHELQQGTVAVLSIARAGLLYLARMIDFHEMTLAKEREKAGTSVLPGMRLPWTMGELD